MGVYGWVDLSTVQGATAVSTETKTPKLSALSIGDIVSFVGTTHYTNASAKKGSKVSPSRAKVINKYPSGVHQVCLRAVNKDGAYVGGGVYGWVDLSDIKI